MSTIAPAMRHVRGFDVVRPLSIGMLMFMMLPLVFLPLASIFIFGTSSGLGKFWAALTAPEAIFALKLSMATSFWATVFNVVFGLFAAYVLSRYNFWGRNALIVTISLPTAIPTAVAGFALLLLLEPASPIAAELVPLSDITKDEGILVADVLDCRSIHLSQPADEGAEAILRRREDAADEEVGDGFG